MSGNAGGGPDLAPEAAAGWPGSAYHIAENERAAGRLTMRWQTGLLIALVTVAVVFFSRWPLGSRHD